MDADPPATDPSLLPSDPRRGPRLLALGCLVLLLVLCSGMWLLARGGSTRPVSVPAPAVEEAAEETRDGEALPTGAVSQADLGDEWPLTVSSGTLACDGSGGVGAVTFTADGTTYAVNGLALQKGLPRLDPIWASEPGEAGAAGPKKSIGPLLDRGLALCP